MVLKARFDVDGVLAAAGDPDIGATLFFGVPTMYARLAETPTWARCGGCGLRVGVGALAADLHARLVARSGQAVLERYGMTETVMLVSNPADGERRPGTSGCRCPASRSGSMPRATRSWCGGPTCSPATRRTRGQARRPSSDGWFAPATSAPGTRPATWPSWGGQGADHHRGLQRAPGDRGRPAGASGVVDVAVVGTPSAEWGEVVTATSSPGQGSMPPPWPGGRRAPGALQAAPPGARGGRLATQRDGQGGARSSDPAGYRSHRPRRVDTSG